MPPSIHGNFDLVVELDQEFITRIARLQLNLRIEKQSIGQDPKKDDMTGEAMISPRLAYIWFNEEGNHVGSLHRQRFTSDNISIVLDLGKGLIRIKTILIRDKLPPVVMEIKEPVGDIPIQGYIDITDRVEMITADAILDRAKPNEKTSSLCAVINFSKDNPYPQIDIRLKKELILDVPLVKLYLTQAQVAGFKLHNGTIIPPGDAAVEAAKNQLLDDIRSQINDAVVKTLESITSWQLNLPGVMPLKIEPIDRSNPPEPLGATALTVRTLGTSLLLLFRTIGLGGNPALVTSSQIGHAIMGITIPHMVIIGGIVRRSIIDSFTGLSQGSFLQGDPCFLASSTRVTPNAQPGEPTPESFNLTSLIAVVDESSQIRIGGSIGDSPLLGAITWTASFEIIIKLDAEVKVLDGIPKLVIIPTVVSSQVTKNDVAIAWWAYVIAGVVAYAYTVVPLLIAAGVDIFGGGSVAGKVKDSLSKIALGSPKATDLPGATKLNVVNTSLYDEDAPVRSITIGPLSVPIGRSHDLSIVLGSEDLPNRLKVSCIIPDSSDEDRRIDAVGGTLPDGTRWGMSIDEAIAAIESGNLTMVVGDQTNEVEVEVVTPSGRIPYLRTKPGKGPNLLQQPRCLDRYD